MKSRIFFLSVMLLAGCNRYARYPLTMSKENYEGNQLNINGMYIKKDSIGTSHMFLYRNGFVRKSTGLDIDNKTTQQIEEYFKLRKSTDCCNDVVYGWGLFKVENQNITVETWVTGEMFDKYQTRTFHGKILNDTTFVLKRFSTDGFDTFRFIPLSIKPDSTNLFIK
jgi:hypothetical protein